MNQVEVIAALCAIIDQQNLIIQDQATQLAQYDAQIVRASCRERVYQLV